MSTLQVPYLISILFPVLQTQTHTHTHTHKHTRTFIHPITCACTFQSHQVHMGLNAEEVMIEMVEGNA